MMSDILSQEEIEALLSGIPTASNGDATPMDKEVITEDYLSEIEIDTLGEIGNISFGSSATALSALLGQKVEITTPTITVVNQAVIEKEFVFPYVAIKVEYTAGLSGMNLLVIKQTDAAIIADLMLGSDGLTPNRELGEIHLSAVQEAMNQMMGSAATSMSTMFNQKVDISPPSIELMNAKEEEGINNISDHDLMIKVAFSLKVGDLIDSEIMQLLPLKFGKELVDRLMNGGTDEAAVAVAEITPPKEEVKAISPASPTLEVKNDQAMKTQKKQHVEVQQAQFASFESPSLNQTESQNLNMLLDIPLQVTVELGRTKRSIKEILEMSSGSIIELDKLAGEPVDILVNQRLIAKGEVVVIDENFGVRITDILSQSDRINNLR